MAALPRHEESSALAPSQRHVSGDGRVLLPSFVDDFTLGPRGS